MEIILEQKYEKKELQKEQYPTVMKLFKKACFSKKREVV